MTPARDQELAVLQAVTYASLFDYPLTVDQLHQCLGVRADVDSMASWWRHSDLLQATVEHRDGWFFPVGRADMVFTRARRESLSRDLLERDRRAIATISRLPFVRMVALSGSLAHLNAEGAADLDLFVITAPNRVWSVTLTVLVISRLMGWRRRMCMNYVVSERTMKVEPEDLFSANQIIHLRPLCGHGVFARFVKANGFVRSFYPNFELPDARPRPDSATASARQAGRWVERLLDLGPAQVAEGVARTCYGWYLRRRAGTWQSRDQVRLDAECLKLHTSSHRAATLRRFDDAMAMVIQNTKDTTNTKLLKVLAS